MATEVVRPGTEFQQRPTMEPQIKSVFAMTQGDGENSYSKNSSVQADLNRVRQSALTESLESVTLPSKDSRAPVVVVDLGSSSSPNSIVNVALIINKLGLRLPKDAEFQAYFNDLPSNDFNHLFQLLTVEDAARGFYAAGVPGSFYDRLFPQSYAHVFHSSLCLHWLSEVPDAVLDKNSPAYNGGNVWYMDSSSAVVEAYKEQSVLDLKSFLGARKAELKPGGLLFLSFMARPSSAQLTAADDEGMSLFAQDLNRICNDLISEGLLSAEHRDSFNFTYYLRSLEEVNGVIGNFGDEFRVLAVKMEDVSRSMDDMFPEVPDEELGLKYVQSCKSLTQSLLEAYLPKDVLDIVWQRLQIISQKRFGANRHLKGKATMCTVSLIRN